jgi:hypothetical protein
MSMPPVQPISKIRALKGRSRILEICFLTFSRIDNRRFTMMAFTAGSVLLRIWLTKELSCTH